MRTCEIIQDGERCRKKHFGKGMCSMHYYRLRRGAQIDMPIQSKGSGHIHKHGYRMVRLNGKTVMEHRVVMAEALGRDLHDHENVHHINGDRLDNRLENLELWSTSQPAGQRVQDKLAWAREIIDLYGDLQVPAN